MSYNDKLSYFEAVTDTDLFSVLPEQYRKYFFTRYMVINNNIPPHTDSGIKCTINFYINSGKFKTKFWNIKDNNTALTFQIKNQTNGKVFKYESLKFDNEFEAVDGDVYLLDVTKPHSVESDSLSVRTALCLQSSVISFETIKKVLQT